MLLTMPILFAVWAALRMMANEQMVQQVFDILQGKEPVMESLAVGEEPVDARQPLLCGVARSEQPSYGDVGYLAECL